LGYAYLENSDDTRNSPTVPFVEALRTAGAEVVIHDPYVREYSTELSGVVSGADCAVIMVRHDEYEDLELGGLRNQLRHAVLVDGRDVVEKQVARDAGFAYVGVGNTV
jgi:UDP-N-acetyl-D-mannosaminuronic acid dehydrogenase